VELTRGAARAARPLGQLGGEMEDTQGASGRVAECRTDGERSQRGGAGQQQHE
jgi:hypothetical protein